LVVSGSELPVFTGPMGNKLGHQLKLSIGCFEAMTSAAEYRNGKSRQ
jgi:hypothetical protein